MSRAGLRQVVLDRNGNAQSGVTVHVYEAGTTTPIAAAMFAAPTGGTTLNNPLTTDVNGEFSFFLAAPQQVDLLVVEGSQTRTLPAVAVGSAAPVPGGGSLPSWWTVDSTPGSEAVTFGGRVRVSPTDQTDTNGEGLMVFETTDDLVNQSNYGAIVAALVKPSAQLGNLSNDYIFMLTVQGLFINAPVEEGAATIEIHARGADPFTVLRNGGMEFWADGTHLGHQLNYNGLGFFAANAVGQQTLGANPTGAEIRAVLAAYGLVAA